MAEKIICDGCNVRDGWEHRCHGETRIMVRGELYNGPCECVPCGELRKMTPEQVRRELKKAEQKRKQPGKERRFS